MARDQVKSELYALFRQEGLQESLKAQMRSKLLSKLRGQVQTKVEDLTSRVLASLVLEYLKKGGKEFTISVFLAEVGSSTTLTPAELTQLLGISSQPDSDSLLAYIVTEFQRLSTRPHLHDSAAQTEDYKAIGHLEDRLHSVELQYLSKMKSLPAAETMEERMLQFQRECEERLRLEKDHEIARIREVEVHAVRLEESTKYRQLLMKAREDMDVQWQTRMDQIKEREKEGSSRLLLREKDLENQQYLHRQQTLRDMELMRAKEQELKRQIQVEGQAAKLEKDTWEARRLEAESKGKEIEKLKLALEHKAEADFEQFKREYETRHLQEKHQLMDELAEVERAKRKLKDEQDRVASFSQEFLRLKQDLAEAQSALSDVKTAKERQAQDLRSTQEQMRQVSESGRRDLDLLSLREQEIATLKGELQLYREMVEESKAASRALDERHKELVAQMSEEVQRLRKTQGSRETGAVVTSLVGTDMSLRWQQLERESEELKLRQMDWIKPVYKRPKDPFADLFAPKREPVVSMDPPVLTPPSDRGTVAAQRHTAAAPVALASVSVVPRVTEVRPRVEERKPEVTEVRRPVELREERKVEERKESPKQEVTPALPVEIPIIPPPVIQTEVPPQEDDLAEYEMRRQQRRRQQFDPFGDESEGSSIYSDRFE